jgi:HAD superfamily hydrolase (TIGR01509 family)
MDWGGTLVRAFRDPFPTYESALRARGISSVDRNRFERAWKTLPTENAARAQAYLGRTDEYWRGWDARVLAALGISDPDGSLSETLRREFIAPRWHAPFPEADEVLQRLVGRGYRIHIVSNNTEDLHSLVANLGWSDRFASITLSQEVGAEKPDPRIFRLALRRAGVEPAGVWYVGDSWKGDVEGARGVGLSPIWLNRESSETPVGVPTITDLWGLFALLDE